MEREVSDTEGIFSRRLAHNWAELPTTLRRRQKHRPEILSQFTDFSESSENEFRKVDSRPTNVQRIVKRSEFLRRLELNEIRRNDDHLEKNGHRKLIPDQFYRPPSDNKRYYDEEKLGQQRRSHFAKFDPKSISDEERKTNSPDSLLVKSSESESSSDEYGHTDDSGAFLEKVSNFEKGSRLKKYKNSILCEQGIHSNGFIKFFAKDEWKRKSKQEERASPEINKLDVNKNIRKNSRTETPIARFFGSNDVSKPKDLKKDYLAQRYEYENIPRIDISKLEPKALPGNFKESESRSATQPTIEQLRLEQRCQLRNTKNSVVSKQSSKACNDNIKGLI